MSLTGEHQLLNAKTAVAIVEALKPLGHNIPVAAIHEGLNKVFWPGRFEVIDEAPLMIIDGAHTKESMEYFVNTFVEQFPRKKATLILGVSQDKNIAAICKVLNRMSGIVIATQARHPRAHVWTHDELEKCFPGKETFLAKDVPTALERAKSIISSDGIIVATGSIFLIGEVRECISLRV
jgi:dihydrofolate synthase/folylpolyglutamate synthase